MLDTSLALEVPDLQSYDKILVAMSGGKDSMACLLTLLELGVPPTMIELHHHDIDGGWEFMDWPVTRSYCKALAAEFSIELVFSWREGGFLRELKRQGTPTAPVTSRREDGTTITVGGKGPAGTRQQFPQVSSDLSVRWCSSALKIDVMDRVICNDPQLAGKRLLIVTGERAEESPARSRYKVFEPHRTAGKRREAHHWRPVHHLKRDEVWSIIRKSGIVPHPAYYIGWGRLSCMKCIFGSDDQWATINEIDMMGLGRIAREERNTGKTIHRTRPVTDRAIQGQPYRAALENPEMVQMALSPHYTGRIWVPASEWIMPAGATGEAVGPT